MPYGSVKPAWTTLYLRERPVADRRSSIEESTRTQTCTFWWQGWLLNMLMSSNDECYRIGSSEDLFLQSDVRYKVSESTYPENWLAFCRTSEDFSYCIQHTDKGAVRGARGRTRWILPYVACVAVRDVSCCTRKEQHRSVCTHPGFTPHTRILSMYFTDMWVDTSLCHMDYRSNKSTLTLRLVQCTGYFRQNFVFVPKPRTNPS